MNWGYLRKTRAHFPAFAHNQPHAMRLCQSYREACLVAMPLLILDGLTKFQQKNGLSFTSIGPCSWNPGTQWAACMSLKRCRYVPTQLMGGR